MAGDADVRPGVVLVSKFVLPGAKVYKSYVDYIDRESATRENNVGKYVSKELIKDLSYKGYVFDYMGKEHLSEVFTDSEDKLTKDSKKNLKDQFETAEKNGSPMWQLVYSFDNDFLSDYGLSDKKTVYLNEAKMREVVRAGMTRLLDSEGLSGTSVYSACTHYNTDNIHDHIAVTEPIPTREEAVLKSVTIPAEYVRDHHILDGNRYTVGTSSKATATRDGYKEIYQNTVKSVKEDGYSLRFGNYLTVNADKSITVSYAGNKEDVPPPFRYSEKKALKGKLKSKSIEAGKSAAVNCIVDQNVEKQKINDIIRKEIVGSVNRDSVFNTKENRELFLKIWCNMPEDKRMWKYNMNAMDDVRPLIDELSDRFLASKGDSYKELNRMLDKADAVYKRAYGGENNRYKESKTKELYASLGNAIIREVRAYSNAVEGDKGPTRSNGGRTRRVRRGQLRAVPKKDSPYKTMRKTDLDIAMRELYRSINDDYEHYKNQLRYEELEYEAEAANEIYEDR